MSTTKKTYLLLTLTGILLGFTTRDAQAVIIDASTPIPDSEVIINFNSTGLDWTYAGPIAPNEFGPGEIETPDYRGIEGWRYATQEEWNLRPEWEDFTRDGFADPTPTDGFADHTVYRFTSQYWSSFNHVDLIDAEEGRITNGLDIGSLTSVWETFYVRTTRDSNNPNPVPDSGTSLALLGGSLVLIGLLRKRVR